MLTLHIENKNMNTPIYNCHFVQKIDLVKNDYFRISLSLHPSLCPALFGMRCNGQKRVTINVTH